MEPRPPIQTTVETYLDGELVDSRTAFVAPPPVDPAVDELRADVASLAEAQEVILTTPANAPARQEVLAAVRALRERLRQRLGGTDGRG